MWTYEKALRDECGYTGYQPVGFVLFQNTNVDLFSTGLGESILPTLSPLHYLMAVTQASVETEDRMRGVLPRDLSRSKYSSPPQSQVLSTKADRVQFHSKPWSC